MVDLSLSKEELWKSRISEYRASGQSARNWCNDNNISVSALKYWITKLNRESHSNDITPEPVFAEVAFSEERSSAAVTIHLGTIRVEVNNNCSPTLLSSLINLLKSHD